MNIRENEHEKKLFVYSSVYPIDNWIGWQTEREFVSGLINIFFEVIPDLAAAFLAASASALAVGFGLVASGLIWSTPDFGTAGASAARRRAAFSRRWASFCAAHAASFSDTMPTGLPSISMRTAPTVHLLKYTLLFT